MSNNWLEKILPAIRRPGADEKKRSEIPEGLWRKCPRCNNALFLPEHERNMSVCSKCDHHMRIGARERLALFFDKGSTSEIGKDIQPVDHLKFRDSKKYKDRLQAAQKATGEDDALVVEKGTVLGLPVVAAAFEFSFMGGSMGSVVGERFVKAVNVCLAERRPLVCFSASGGARMQEALFSLMQMAKTSAALQRMREEGLPYISVLTDPVYGGVSASLAMLGDINVAEPNALIGFAGPRVIEQTVRQQLPEGFQRSEFLLDHGAIDMIVHRHDLTETLHRLLASLMGVPSTQEEEIVLAAEETEEESQAETDVENSSNNEK